MSKEKKHRGRYIAAGVIIAAILGGLGFGFGSGFFRTSVTGGADTTDSPVIPAQTATPGPEPTQDLRYNISVCESVIEYQGQSITLDDLREQLLHSYTGVEIYELHDNHALKSVYDSVRSLLEDIGVPYMEQ